MENWYLLASKDGTSFQHVRTGELSVLYSYAWALRLGEVPRQPGTPLWDAEELRVVQAAGDTALRASIENSEILEEQALEEEATKTHKFSVSRPNGAPYTDEEFAYVESELLHSDDNELTWSVWLCQNDQYDFGEGFRTRRQAFAWTYRVAVGHMPGIQPADETEFLIVWMKSDALDRLKDESVASEQLVARHLPWNLARKQPPEFRTAGLRAQSPLAVNEAEVVRRELQMAEYCEVIEPGVTYRYPCPNGENSEITAHSAVVVTGDGRFGATVHCDEDDCGFETKLLLDIVETQDQDVEWKKERSITTEEAVSRTHSLVTACAEAADDSKPVTRRVVTESPYEVLEQTCAHVSSADADRFPVIITNRPDEVAEVLPSWLGPTIVRRPELSEPRCRRTQTLSFRDAYYDDVPLHERAFEQAFQFFRGSVSFERVDEESDDHLRLQPTTFRWSPTYVCNACPWIELDTSSDEDRREPCEYQGTIRAGSEEDGVLIIPSSDWETALHRDDLNAHGTPVLVYFGDLEALRSPTVRIDGSMVRDDSDEPVAFIPRTLDSSHTPEPVNGSEDLEPLQVTEKTLPNFASLGVAPPTTAPFQRTPPSRMLHAQLSALASNWQQAVDDGIEELAVKVQGALQHTPDESEAGLEDVLETFDDLVNCMEDGDIEGMRTNVGRLLDHYKIDNIERRRGAAIDVESGHPAYQDQRRRTFERVEIRSEDPESDDGYRSEIIDLTEPETHLVEASRPFQLAVRLQDTLSTYSRYRAVHEWCSRLDLNRSQSRGIASRFLQAFAFDRGTDIGRLERKEDRDHFVLSYDSQSLTTPHIEISRDSCRNARAPNRIEALRCGDDTEISDHHPYAASSEIIHCYKKAWSRSQVWKGNDDNWIDAWRTGGDAGPLPEFLEVLEALEDEGEKWGVVTHSESELADFLDERFSTFNPESDSAAFQTNQVARTLTDVDWLFVIGTTGFPEVRQYEDVIRARGHLQIGESTPQQGNGPSNGYVPPHLGYGTTLGYPSHSGSPQTQRIEARRADEKALHRAIHAVIPQHGHKRIVVLSQIGFVCRACDICFDYWLLDRPTDWVIRAAEARKHGLSHGHTRRRLVGRGGGRLFTADAPETDDSAPPMSVEEVHYARRLATYTDWSTNSIRKALGRDWQTVDDHL